MCDGVTNLDLVEEDFDHGVHLTMRLDQLCEEHGGTVVGYGALFVGADVVQRFDPIEFSADEEGRLRFSEAVTGITADVQMQMGIARMIGILPGDNL